MPVYNHADYVGEAIDSILGQTFGDFELLIMDDGSTDATPDIIGRYARRDRRIRVFRRSHQGQVACRNELLTLAAADIVACMDSDDISTPDRLRRQYERMAPDSDLWVLGTARGTIDHNGHVRRRLKVLTGAAAVARDLKRGCSLVHSSSMMRRANILEIGGYRAAFSCAQDYDLFLRASEHGKVDNINFVGVYSRQHNNRVGKRDNLQQAICADLARSTHRLRVQGKQDPLDDLYGPLDVNDPLLDTILPEQIAFHRAVEAAFDPGSSADRTEQALRYFLSARVGKKQGRAFQRAIVHLIRNRPLDLMSGAAAARAVALGPLRLTRLLLRST